MQGSFNQWTARDYVCDCFRVIDRGCTSNLDSNRLSCPFAIANDTGGAVRMVLDRGLMEHDPLNFHPLDNTRTTAIAPADLLRFLEDTGHPPQMLEMD